MFACSELACSKIRDAVLLFQFQIHTSMESIYNEVDMSVLPSEYLPDDYSGPTAGSHNDIIGKYE